MSEVPMSPQPSWRILRLARARCFAPMAIAMVAWGTPSRSSTNGASAGHGDWLLGYLTGANVWAPKGGLDLLANQTGAELIESIDRYCQEHPDGAIEDGARRLVIELAAQARARAGTVSNRPFKSGQIGR